MERISINDVERYTGGKIVLQVCNTEINEISIDSRDVGDNTLFIPIIGNVHDGHDFFEDAYELGCRNFICDQMHSFDKDDINLVKVDDTTRALGDIAKGYREKFNVKVIAVTGSVGKTSTKDIINSVLSVKYNTIKTIGNLNNEIGVPKTLFTMKNNTELAVVEMGMDHKGEMDYLTNLVNPDVAVITNIGMSHIMNFDDQDGIFKAKMEIVNGLKDNGLLVVNGDDKYLKTIRGNEEKYKILTYGFNADNDIFCKDYQLGEEYSLFTCVYNGEEYSFRIKSIAKHNIGNALIAIVLGFMYNLSYDEIQEGLLEIEFSKNRLDVVKTDRYTIINDTYNSSYDSVMSAIGVLNSFKTRRVAILGDILELGDYSEEIHRRIGKDIKCDVLVTIGKDAKYIMEEANGVKSYYYSTKNSLYDEIGSILEEGDTVLVKASRGMELDKVVDYLRKM